VAAAWLWCRVRRMGRLGQLDKGINPWCLLCLAGTSTGRVWQAPVLLSPVPSLRHGPRCQLQPRGCSVGSASKFNT
jgi:hypothetical protein